MTVVLDMTDDEVEVLLHVWVTVVMPTAVHIGKLTALSRTPVYGRAEQKWRMHAVELRELPGWLYAGEMVAFTFEGGP